MSEKELKKKKYDFRCLDEEVSIGVVVKSDLSKTIANWMYKNTSDLEIAEIARELFYNGVVSFDERFRAFLVEAIMNSNLICSVKQAVGKLLSEKVS